MILSRPHPPAALLADRHPKLLKKRLRHLAAEAGVPGRDLIAILALQAMTNEQQTAASALFIIYALINILPFILVSVTIAAGLKAASADNLVASAFFMRPATAIVMASLFGALSPLCSYGVVPLVASLLVTGIPIAPALVFCIALPIIHPKMFILTATGLGLEFAGMKTIASTSVGILADFVALTISNAGLLVNVLKPILKPSCCVHGPETPPPPVWRF